MLVPLARVGPDMAPPAAAAADPAHSDSNEKITGRKRRHVCSRARRLTGKLTGEESEQETGGSADEWWKK